MGILVSKPQIILGIPTPNNFPCSSPLSLPSLPSAPQGAKRSSLPSTSQPAKRRKTSCQQPTTSNAIQSGDQEKCEKSSYGCTCPQVFLSHSGKQKNFVEQLFEDLTRENISCFFDKDPQSLPKGEDFPSRIFQAAKKCRVGVVVLSEEFISSKWPMQELSAFVKAKKSTNPKLIILPLFFGFSADSLSQKLQNKDSLKRIWQKSLKDKKRKIDLDEWLDALEALRPINGVNYVEQEGEVGYRAQIVGHIRRCLPPSLKYEESDVEGKERLCQEVAELFKNAPCRENGVKVAGVYGVGGIGKTTLARIVCNFFSRDFDGRVFHVEFSKEPTRIERLKNALRNFTDASDTRVNSVTTMAGGWPLLKQIMHGKRVFLAVDGISHLSESIEDAKMYLEAVRFAGTQSMILLTARSSTVLKRFIPEGEGSFMHVPPLQEEEAMAVFLQLTPLRVSDLSDEGKDIARKYVWKCYFGRNCVTYGTCDGQYHPLALKLFGAYLYDKFDSCADLSRWIDIRNSSCPLRSGDTQEEIFSIFKDCFQSLPEEHTMVFMLLCLYLPHSNMTSEEVFNWLALACSRDVQDIESAVIQLKRKGFVESDRGLCIHDLFIEFAANKADGKGKWISLEERDEIPISLQEELSSDRPGFLAMKINNCHFPCSESLKVELFRNILVLHLQHMPQLKILNLTPMRNVRSITIVGCGGIEEIRGLENLTNLAYFRVESCDANVQLLGIERLLALRHFELLGKTATESLQFRSPALQFRSAWFPPLQHFSNLGSIQLDHFEKGTGQLRLSGCPKLQTIKLSRCNKTETDFSGCLELRTIELEYCENLSELHSLTGLTELRYLYMREMHSLKGLPSLTGVTELRCLYMREMRSLKEFPSLTGATELRCLYMREMHSLKELPSLARVTQLRYLYMREMHSLKEFPSLTGLTELRYLYLKEMKSLKELPSLTGLTELRYLYLEEMHSLKELPSLTGLTYLDGIHLRGMHDLKELPSLTGLTKLRSLFLYELYSLEELPNLTGLTGLRRLDLKGMKRLKELPSFTGLTKLVQLVLDGLHSLKELPNLTGLTELRCLQLDGLHSLKELPSLTGLVNLFFLGLEGMHDLKEFPNLTGLTHLSTLYLGGMPKLKEVPNLTGLSGLKFLALGEEMHCMEIRTELSGVKRLRLNEVVNPTELHGVRLFARPDEITESVLRMKYFPIFRSLPWAGSGRTPSFEDIPEGLGDQLCCTGPGYDAFGLMQAGFGTFYAFLLQDSIIG